MSKRDVKPSGMKCSFRGTIVKDPIIGTTKKGTPCLSGVASYTEFNGDSRICKFNYFGKDISAMADKLCRHMDVEVHGAVVSNTWAKDGETKTGLLVMANKITVLDGDDETSFYQSLDDCHF